MHFDPLAIVLEGERPSDNPRTLDLAEVEKNASALERKPDSGVIALGGDRVADSRDLGGYNWTTPAAVCYPVFSGATSLTGGFREHRNSKGSA